MNLATLTRAELENLKSENDYLRARRSFLHYYQRSRGHIPAPHQVLICNTVQTFLESCWNTEAANTQFFRILIINLPPGAGKSTILSAALPEWVLGQRPYERMGLVSAKGDLSSLFEIVVKGELQTAGSYFHRVFDRAVLQSDLVRLRCSHLWLRGVPEVPPIPDQADKGQLRRARKFNHHPLHPDYTRAWRKGTLYLNALPPGEITPSINAMGIYGSVLGKRLTLLVLDDPEDQASAATAHMREKTWDFIVGTVLTRTIPGSPIICVQQRWHEEDISGRLREKYGAQVLEIPALEDFEGPNERSYWPDRYSVGWLKMQYSANPGLFWANFMEQPGVGSGDIFTQDELEKHLYDALPEDRTNWRFLRSWDTANKIAEKNDLSAYVSAWVDPLDNIWITDFGWGKYEIDVLQVQVVKLDNQQAADETLIEDAASGTQLIQLLRKQTQVRAVAITPEGNKLERARGTKGWLKIGKVRFPAHHPRLEEFFAFLQGFPLLKLKDPVDAYSQLVNYVIERRIPRKKVERKRSKQTFNR